MNNLRQVDNKYINYEFSSNSEFFNVIISFDAFLKCFVSANISEMDKIELAIKHQLLGIYLQNTSLITNF